MIHDADFCQDPNETVSEPNLHLLCMFERLINVLLDALSTERVSNYSMFTTAAFSCVM